MSATAPVSAVIPVHNRADLLAGLLDTIAAQTAGFSEVIVVDNASTDGAPELAESRGCQVLRCTTNEGFAAAVNRGWRAATQHWIAVLNSDVELHPEWLARLLGSSGISGFATGKILNASDRSLVDGTYDLLARSGCAWRAGYGESDTASVAHTQAVLPPGTACIWRRDVLNRLGGYDEDFRSYLEDVDLGLRALKAGLKGTYEPRAIAFHYGSATLGRWNHEVVRLTSRNQLRLVEKHYDRALFRECLWSILAGQLLWGLVAAKHGAGRAWMKGKLEGIRSLRISGLSGEPSLALRRFLDASECEIEHRSRDPYWSLYFRCAPRRVLGQSDT